MKLEAGLRLPWWAFLAAGVLAGCSTASNSGDRGDGGASELPCPVCLASQICYDGSCYDTSCGSQQCPPSAICYGGSCVSTSCVGVVCPAGSLCAGGQCPSTTCGTTPCPAGEICSDSTCISPDCFGVVCPAGYLCANGGCESTSCGTTQCSAGDVCNGDGPCIQATCVGVTCSTGETCANGGCYDSACSNEVCPEGEVCSPLGYCESVACAGVPCASGTLCAGGTCQPTTCGETECALGEVCSGSGDSCVAADCFGVSCPTGFLCGGGACLSTTCGATECPAGDVCSSTTGTGCVQASCVDVTCPFGEACGNGGCYPESCPNQLCPTGDICSPGDQCESASCGGISCAAGTLCAGGSCQPISCGTTQCSTDQVCDGTACVQIDCFDVPCPGEACANGSCYATTGPTTSCPTGEVYCSDGCVPLDCIGVVCPSDLCTDRDCKAGACSPAPVPTTRPPPITGALNQVENNSAVTVVGWPDGGIEAFVRTTAGAVTHVMTDRSPTRWYPSAAFSGSAASCGVAATLSFAGEPQAEVLTPTNSNETQSLYYRGGWHPFENFAGAGMAQLTTLRWADDGSGGWNDGRPQVFGLNKNGHIYYNWFNPGTGRWSGWKQLGGRSFATGPSAILDQAGDAVVFAVDGHQNPWYTQSLQPMGDAWSAWKPLGGSLSTRPVVVRDGAGTLHVFGRGMNGWLYTARSTATGFSKFGPIDPGFELAGEPSAALDDGTVAVFVRDLSKHVSYSTERSNGTFTNFAHFSTTQFISDPFAWQLSTTGRIEVFAIDSNNVLRSSYHAGSSWSAWSGWAQHDSGVDPCTSSPLAPQCPNGDGAYCGGHGVGGATGTLYACNAGKLSDPTPCTYGCTEIGQGKTDQCNSAPPIVSCTTNADCADGGAGQCAVCVQPSQQCGGDTSANYCSPDLTNVLGQTCASSTDCDPCSTGTLVCVSCPPTVGRTCNGNCCQSAN